MKKLIAAAAIALPFIAAGQVSAGEPMRLSDDQLDGVSAGASAFADALAAGVGSVVFTEAYTLAEVAVVDTYRSELTTIRLHGSQSIAGAAVSAN